ncbi:hypothetical protein Dsin_009610 [Dipteronia sinensis]|uniref:PLAC8 family protein n=1 Tax=Dipteronia sinensis TaxID=43782 RepID=A0AAE0ARW3_9ROSI|nr:hypothetical protein Dsin_009610 [Dipteronia sinensis]
MYPNNPEVADLNSGPTPDQDQQWSTGLYDCCEDPKNCLIALLCPCITFGQIAEIIDRGNLLQYMHLQHAKFRVWYTMLWPVLVAGGCTEASIVPKCVDTCHYQKLRTRTGCFTVAAAFVPLLKSTEN